MRNAALLLLLAACSSDTADPVEDEDVDCTMVTDDDTFVVGLEKMGHDGVLAFKLMSATPAPPARYLNTWVLQIDANGAPLANAEIQATPYMPAHDHVAAIHAVTTALADAGEYQVDRIDFSMHGVWLATIRATAGSTTDSAVFKFCIE